MAIYYVVLMVSLLLMFCFARIKIDHGQLKLNVNGYFGERSLVAVLVTGLPLIVFSSVQYGVGSDYFPYVDMVINCPTEKIEYLFKFIYNCINGAQLEPQWIFVSTSILIVCLFISTFYKYSPIPCLSLFLFVMSSVYTTTTLNVIRYGVALAFVFYSYRYIETRNLKKFLLCMFCAVGFHNIAFIFIPMYWVYGLSISYTILWAITIFLFIVKEYLGNLVVYLSHLTNYGFYIAIYLGTSPFSLTVTLIYVSIVVCAIAFKMEDTRSRFFINCLFIAMWLGFVSYWLPEIWRFRTLFDIFAILLIPMIAVKIEDKFLRYGYLISVICCYAWIGRTLGEYKEGAALVDAYKTIYDVGLSLF